MAQRVSFDFEIAFTNGGRLQGQDFRLDIPGPAVTDEWIADAVVRDLRLLTMAGVRILNRRIIEEPHKRGLGLATAGATLVTGRRLVDLSHPIDEGMTTYPGLPVPEIHPFLTREASVLCPRRDLCDRRADPVREHRDLCRQSVPPVRRWHGPRRLAARAAGRRAGGAGRRDRLRTTAVDAPALLPYELDGRAVLVHTGHDRHWGTDADGHDNPFLTAAAVKLLVDAGAAMVGIDSVNIDDPADLARPAHSGLLAAGIPICQHLTNLAAVPVEGALFSALPAPVRGTGTFPVHAVASIPA
jgi:kynurenine formamidase